MALTPPASSASHAGRTLVSRGEGSVKMVRRFGLDPVLESRTRSISWASVSPERLHQPQARAGTRAEKPPAGREDHVTIGSALRACSVEVTTTGGWTPSAYVCCRFPRSPVDPSLRRRPARDVARGPDPPAHLHVVFTSVGKPRSGARHPQ